MNNDKKFILAFFVVLLLSISNMITVNKLDIVSDRLEVLENEKDSIYDQLTESYDRLEVVEKELEYEKQEVESLRSDLSKLSEAAIQKEYSWDDSNLETEINEADNDYASEIVQSASVIVKEKSVKVEEVSVTTEEEISAEIEESSNQTEESNTEIGFDIPWVVYEVVECETHGADKESKIHIAHVIRNRVNSSLFPNNYYDVCTSPNQFGLRSDVEQSTIDAVDEAMAMGDTTGGALFFHSMGYQDTFYGYKYIFTDNAGHHFYGE